MTVPEIRPAGPAGTSRRHCRRQIACASPASGGSPATIAMQTASGTDPLHLQATDKTETQARQARTETAAAAGRKPCMNAAMANRPKVSAKISSIAIRDCTNTIWLKKASRRGGERGALAANSARPHKIHRDDRERAEQHAG